MHSPRVRYLLVGGGRLARHFAHYLTLENLPFTQWTRSSREPFALGDSTHVLLAISDRAIEDFVRSHDFAGRTVIHFSGALATPLAPSVHPLVTFGPELYSLETYRSIPFIVEREGLTPGLTNRSHVLSAEMKPLYHAACAMSGNFTVLLWQKVFAIFEKELGLPRSVLYPYLAQTTTNLMSGRDVLTGPLARGDFATVEKHLQALGDDPYGGVYRAFVDAFGASFGEAQR